MTPSSGHGEHQSILVVTVVHDPRDARIWFRQIRALLAAGWRVTYAAPFSQIAEVSVDDLAPEDAARLELVDVPRARARHRARAALTARRLLRDRGAEHDVVLVHDPELLLAAIGLDLPHLVWDVHEDPAAALGVKAWMPGPLRGPASRGWRRVERWAEENRSLILAERSYQKRFRRRHPVVLNSVTVPEGRRPSTTRRVLYLGSVTSVRGGDLLPAIGAGLRERTGGSIQLEVIGGAHDASTERALLSAQEAGDLIWHGYLPSDQALDRVSGALAGLALLSDVPNYHLSLPTKVVEYCALGVPVITTPLPLAARLVTEHEVGVVVPYADPAAVVDAVVQLAADQEAADQMGARGHELALREHDWRHWSAVFIDEMARFADHRSARSRPHAHSFQPRRV
ncbi:glycosyltransferase [Auraticoccus monumenti]|uniref:Glycosyltransferase involved in cell wall bisynthesis n=1 Tax=Auraticoccus monumenti TaxID=675864 RepID=A0A1G6RHG3_9ACTN|nr:glycosyltransferase [Auraticoccus monumenti]SDD04072.1 Glycosyltransferase involved in cell wall bisynthesis [Auraticoccus monumenti]